MDRAFRGCGKVGFQAESMAQGLKPMLMLQPLCRD